MTDETVARIEALEEQVKQLHNKSRALLLISLEHTEVLSQLWGTIEELVGPEEPKDMMSELASQIEKARMTKSHLS